ncbi:MAG: winged helix-turn-helix domain-containing protein [Opitutaceae bacterium]|nr:winged helix-turn-helix domain-containing protein [Opitutaceae bacterium]
MPRLAAAFAEKFGRRVSTSSLYRLAAAAGWRKVAPRSHHPKKTVRQRGGVQKNSRKSPGSNGRVARGKTRR